MQREPWVTVCGRKITAFSRKQHPIPSFQGRTMTAPCISIDTLVLFRFIPYKLAKSAQSAKVGGGVLRHAVFVFSTSSRLLGGCNLFCPNCYQCSHRRAQLAGRIQKISNRICSSTDMLGDCVLGKTLGPAEALHVFPHFKMLPAQGLHLRVPLLRHAILV